MNPVYKQFEVYLTVNDFCSYNLDDSVGISNCSRLRRCDNVNFISGRNKLEYVICNSCTGINNDYVRIFKGTELFCKIFKFLNRKVCNLRKTVGTGNEFNSEFCIKNDFLHRLFLVDYVHEVVLRHKIKQNVYIRHTQVTVNQDYFFSKLSIGNSHVH